jgi:hypothetical protein
MINFRAGQVLLLSKMTSTTSFDHKGPVEQHKYPAGQLGAWLYLDTVDSSRIENFSADGCLLALGFGPQVFTKQTRALVDALKAARAHLGAEAPSGLTDEQVLNQIDAALDGVKAFTAATEPKNG